MKTKLYQQIARSFDAYLRCIDNANSLWEGRHREQIDGLVKDHLPSGSGFDSGTEFDWDKSTPQKLVFNVSFHHMNQDGYYTHWTDHSVIVTPCLLFGFRLRVTGRDHQDIKDYIAEVFANCLSEEID